jgi:daunorubicin resistance ABC transporter membrane protein
MVWRRELIRFRGDRLRAVTSLVQPVLFLFDLGTGLSTLAGSSMPPGVDFRTFMYPGVLARAVLFTAIFSAGSIVWDREFGFLREMLVAPGSRSAIVIGKCLGGATISTFQGVVILALAGLAGVPYSPGLFAALIGELLLLAFTLTAFGVMLAARITQFQAFMVLSQMLIMPLFFLSGALYPLRGLPTWLAVLADRPDPARPADLRGGPDAPDRLRAPGDQPGGGERAGPERDLGRLGRPRGALAGDRPGDGPEPDGRGDRRVPPDRVNQGWLRGLSPARVRHGPSTPAAFQDA